jgi:hypothetical protein
LASLDGDGFGHKGKIVDLHLDNARYRIAAHAPRIIGTTGPGGVARAGLIAARGSACVIRGIIRPGVRPRTTLSASQGDRKNDTR